MTDGTLLPSVLRDFYRTKIHTQLLCQYRTTPSGETATQEADWLSLELVMTHTRDALCAKSLGGEQDSIQMTQLKTWLLDIQLLYDGVMVLGAAVNLEALPTLHYALAVISMDMSESPTCLQTLTVLDHTERYEEHLESQLIAYKLLLPTVNTSTFYIYDSQTVIA
ncbi:hypothetical protein ScPMuIL_011694, partial [Solemya velum]